MFDSLPYRNDAATVFRRLIRSLPTRSGVIGVATCDKGLPAMMMALAAMHDLPCVLVPGGVTLRPRTARTPARVQIHRRPLRARPDHARSRPPRIWLPRLRHRPAAAASSWAPRPPRRWSARPWACRCRTPRWRPPAIPSGSTWRAARPAPLHGAGSPRPDHARHPDRRLAPQRHGGACRFRRLDQPDPAHARDRPRRRTARGRPSPIGRASTARCRAWWMRCPTARASSRPCRSSWPAAFPK